MPTKIGNGGFLYDGGEAVPQSDLEWVVQGWIPKNGKTLLVADPKVGKTLLSNYIAERVSESEDVFGYPTEQGVVLYVVLERWPDYWDKHRSLTHGKCHQNFKTLEYREPLPLDEFDKKYDPNSKKYVPLKRNSFDTLKGVIDTVKPILTIIDSKFHTTMFKESDEEATKRWINSINDLIKSCDTAFLILRHSPKQKYDNLVDRGAGSNFISRWADVIICMSKVNAGFGVRDPSRNLEFISNAGSEPDDMQFKIVTDSQGNMNLEEPVQVQPRILDAHDYLKDDMNARPNVGITKRIEELSVKHGIGKATFWRAYKLIK